MHVLFYEFQVTYILYAALFWCVLFVGSCITATATLSLHIFWGALFMWFIFTLSLSKENSYNFFSACKGPLNLTLLAVNLHSYSHRSWHKPYRKNIAWKFAFKLWKKLRNIFGAHRIKSSEDKRVVTYGSFHHFAFYIFFLLW